jgi:phosphoglycerol transferase MdoB-like AlkP superfamily enzyme
MPSQHPDPAHITLPREFLHTRAGGWCLALAFVVIWYALLQGITWLSLDVAPGPKAIPRDLLMNLLLGALLYGMSRGLAWYLPATGFLMAAMHLSNAGKIAVLGGPIMPDDLLAMTNLYYLLEGWQWLGAIAVVAVPISLLVLMTAWYTVRAWLVISTLLVTGVVVAAIPGTVVHAMDQSLGTIVWNQRGNFENRGLLLHLLQEGARYLDRTGSPPGRPEVEQALAVLQDTEPTRPTFRDGRPRRNLHLILLESFWDVMLLEDAGLSQDPIDPEFRELWAAAGHSRILSPVFGGYTANAEFELLCGFPVIEDAVFFEGWLRNDVPCLPRHLGSDGYRTLVSHPNVASFWNRVNAYERIGFDTYWSINDFELDDMNRGFLSDASLYRQVLEKIDPLLQDSAPVFNYILTYFGHLDYPLNERRPIQVTSSSANSLLERYVNTLYYKSRELMVFLKELRRRDPDALIILFGDHLPFLGPNFAGFTDSGFLADKRGDFDAVMVQRLTSVPLVIIDGQRGPLAAGDLPMFQLPALILQLLGDERPSFMEMTAETRIRPLPGMHLEIRDNRLQLCRDGSAVDPECGISRDWMNAVITLTSDIFGGEQYALKAQQSLNLSQTAMQRRP